MSNITMSNPAGAALLRKLRQPLYDTNILANAVAPNRYQFFFLPIGVNFAIAGGLPKTEADTNLTQASQLGVPQMFDLESFNFEYFETSGADVANMAADLFQLYGQSVFTFFFGQNRPWLEIPLSQIPTGPALTGDVRDSDITGNTEAMFVHEGLASVKENYNFTIGKQPIRIHSAEGFSAEITWPNGGTGAWTAASSRCRVFLNGNLYAAL